MNRNDAIVIAKKCALNSNENHGYLPRSIESLDLFEPHEWVIQAIISATENKLTGSEVNVVNANFNTSYAVLVNLEEDILKVAEKYDGKIPLAAFIGVLEIVKSGYLNKS